MRPCLKCQRLIRQGTYHAACNPKNAYRDPEYVKLRRDLLATHRRYQGAWCPGAPDINHLPHESNDLTIDHINEDNTDHRLENLRILCRGANARRVKR